MGFRYRVLKRQAVKMGTKFSRNSNSKVLKKSDYSVVSNNEKSPSKDRFLMSNCPDWIQQSGSIKVERTQDKLEREPHYQKVWLDAQAKQPTLNLLNLARMYPEEYYRLMKYCPDWCKQNSPPPIKLKNCIYEKIEYYQDVWLKARAEFPLLGRTALAVKFPSVARQLLKHCPDWYDRNNPAKRVNRFRKPFNWHERDVMISCKLAEEYQKQIAPTTQLPKRITKKGLFRGAGILNLFYAWNLNKDKLPLTVALLGEACENSVGYRLRKIEWAKDCCIKRGIVPSRNQLNQLASIRKGNLARVFSDAIDKAIEDIKKVVLVFPPINDDGPTLL